MEDEQIPMEVTMTTLKGAIITTMVVLRTNIEEVVHMIIEIVEVKGGVVIIKT